MIRVTAVRYVKDYIVWVRFNDGVEGEVDLKAELYGEVFKPLANKKLFRSVAVHPDWHTIAWPNGADFAPEFLYTAVKAGLRQLRPRKPSRAHARSGAASHNGRR